MSAAAATALISYIPTFRSSPCLTRRLKSPKHISFREFSISKPVLLGAFLSRMSDLEKFRDSDAKPMTEMIRAAGLGRSDSDEDSGYMETQIILRNGSSEFRRELDVGGLESALNQLSKWLVAGLFGSIIIWKHDAEAMWVAMGAVINSSLSITLKRILNQRRPVPSMRSDPGMPSSHAQSIVYAAVFTIFSLVEWLGINALTLTAGAFILACSSYFLWLRVSQQLHTINQVVVGAVLGAFVSIMWFWSWDAFILKAFQSFLWVRIVVILGSVSFSLAFLLYVIKNWLLKDD